MDDDERLKQIGEKYGSGRMLTGEIKAELIKVCSAAEPSFLCPHYPEALTELHALEYTTPLRKPLRHHCFAARFPALGLCPVVRMFTFLRPTRTLGEPLIRHCDTHRSYRSS